MFDVTQIRKDFPMLRGLKMQNKDFIYFDNAATTLKPYCVIDAIKDYYENYSMNTHRGDYDFAYKADEAYEESRQIVASFIGAKKTEIAFTSGASMGLNVIAYGWKKFLTKDDEILLTEAEHASNVLPWFRVKDEVGCKISYIPLNEEGKCTSENLRKVISSKTKIVSLAHITNVLGFENDIKELCKIAHEYGAIFVCDGAQSVPHMKINVKDLDVDFLTFSGHKMCGPTGIGVLYGKFELLDKIDPLLLGGGMNSTFSLCGDVSLLLPPTKFEAGTQNIEGVIGLGAAIKYLEKTGMSNIEKYERELRAYLIKKIKQVPNIILYNEKASTGIVTFNIKGIHAQDESSLLNSKGICVRSGQHCAKLLVERFGTDATCRASLYFYNTYAEIDAFVSALMEGGDFLDAFFN